MRNNNCQTAQKNLQIARTGVAEGLQSLATTQIRSKPLGTVLEVSVKVGYQVIEANQFTLELLFCSVADLYNSLIFEGKIDELEAGKIKGRHGDEHSDRVLYKIKLSQEE